MPSDTDIVETSSLSSHAASQRIFKAFLPANHVDIPPSQAKDTTTATNGTLMDRSSSSSNKETLPELKVYQTMQQKIEEWSDKDDESFTVCDLGDVYRQHLRWKTHLPRVEPFYGMYSLEDGYCEQ